MRSEQRERPEHSVVGPVQHGLRVRVIRRTHERRREDRTDGGSSHRVGRFVGMHGGHASSHKDDEAAFARVELSDELRRRGGQGVVVIPVGGAGELRGELRPHGRPEVFRNLAQVRFD